MSMTRRTLVRLAAAALPLSAARAARSAEAEIVLGESVPLTGPNAAGPLAFNAGALLVFDALNAAGGLNGRRIRLVALDDDLKPERAVANYRKLLDEHRAFAFFGSIGSSTTIAAVDVLRSSGAPLLGGYSAGDTAREKAAGLAYWVRAGYRREAEVVAQYLGTIGHKRVAMAHINSSGGTEAAEAVRAALTAAGLTLVDAVGVDNAAESAYAAGKRLAAQSPQSVVLFLGGPLSAEVMRGVIDSGASTLFYGMSLVAGELVAKALGERARGLAIAQLVSWPWESADATTREYQRLAAAAKLPISYRSFEGFINAKVMVEALQLMGRELSREKLHAALRALKMKVAGVSIDFTGGRHTGSRFVELVQLRQDGKFLR